MTARSVIRDARVRFQNVFLCVKVSVWCVLCAVAVCQAAASKYSVLSQSTVARYEHLAKQLSSSLDASRLVRVCGVCVCGCVCMVRVRIQLVCIKLYVGVCAHSSCSPMLTPFARACLYV